MLTACGGDSPSPSSAATGTLAYVLTECRDTPTGFFEHQELHVRQGDRDVIVFQPAEVGPVTNIPGLCRSLTMPRNGAISVAREAIQGVLVSPDGSTVVFQSSDDFSVLPKLPLRLPPEQQGIFAVRADGTGLRRLGPPNHLPFFFVRGLDVVPVGGLQFSPDGRRLAVVDSGPDSSGTAASQIWIIDVATGTRRQITQLPPPSAPTDLPAGSPTIVGFSFLDNRTVGFLSYGHAGSSQLHKSRLFAVDTDNSELRQIDSPVAVGGAIVPIFGITGTSPQAAPLELPGPPVNCSFGATLQDIFLFDGSNVLQLTNFRRCDTGQTGATLVDTDDQHVYFAASANVAELGGSNPSESCQLFSVDRTGTNLRQLTTFSELATGGVAPLGCTFARGPSCAVGPVAQDARTRRLIIYSNCDLLGRHFVGAHRMARRSSNSPMPPVWSHSQMATSWESCQGRTRTGRTANNSMAQPNRASTSVRLRTTVLGSRLRPSDSL